MRNESPVVGSAAFGWYFCLRRGSYVMTLQEKEIVPTIRKTQKISLCFRLKRTRILSKYAKFTKRRSKFIWNLIKISLLVARMLQSDDLCYSNIGELCRCPNKIGRKSRLQGTNRLPCTNRWHKFATLVIIKTLVIKIWYHILDVSITTPL